MTFQLSQLGPSNVIKNLFFLLNDNLHPFLQ